MTAVCVTTNNYLVLYISLACLTLLLCLYVIISYFRNKDYRKAPAGMMVSKTFSDLIFSFIFFLMLLTVHRKQEDSSLGDCTPDNSATDSCKVYGPIFSCVFITAQGYFISICWDLYRTLSNPFRPPASDSIKLHISVWLVAGIMVLSLTQFNIYRYRQAYGICYTCNTGSSFSYYNLLLFYIPLFISNASGFSVTIYAFKRLKTGLEKKFELRQYVLV